MRGVLPKWPSTKEGYWTLNDRRLTDASGNPVKAEGKQTSLITGISRDDNGNAIFTLGDGSTVSAPIFDAFNIVFKIGDTAFDDEYTVEDVSQPLTIGYEIAGEKADEAILKIVRCEQLEAVVDTSAETVVVTFETPFEEGCFALMLCDLQENVLIRMVRLASASAKPEYYGIKTADDLREFARAVNTGRNYDRYRDETGDVVLLDDVDMNGITEWTAIWNDRTPILRQVQRQRPYDPQHRMDGRCREIDGTRSVRRTESGLRPESHGRRLGRSDHRPGDCRSRYGHRGRSGVRYGIGHRKRRQQRLDLVRRRRPLPTRPVMLAGIVGQMSGTTLGRTIRRSRVYQ